MARSATARPAGRRYSMGEYGQSERSQLQGNHIIKPGSGQLWKPSFEGGPTTIRIFPVRCPENPSQWEPYRWSADKDEFGDWIRRYPAIRQYGDQAQVTFITHDPADKSTDPQMLPGWLLYKNVKALVDRKGDPGWGGFLQGSTGRSAALSKPSEVYLVQAAMMASKGKLHQPPRGGGDDPLLIMELGPSAGQAMIDLLNEVNPAYNGPDDNFDQMMVWGDPVSLHLGRYITFYNLEHGDPRQARVYANQGQAGQVRSAADAFAAGNGQRGFRSSSQQGYQPKGYGCYIEPTFNNFGANLQALENMIAAKTRGWDDILLFPTPEEQAGLLADKFPADMICYAWRDRPEWIPEHVAQRAMAMRQTQFGQAGYGPGAVAGAAPLMGAPPAMGGWGAPPGQQAAYTPPQGLYGQQGPVDGNVAAQGQGGGYAPQGAQEAVPQAPGGMQGWVAPVQQGSAAAPPTQPAYFQPQQGTVPQAAPQPVGGYQPPQTPYQPPQTAPAPYQQPPLQQQTFPGYPQQQGQPQGYFPQQQTVPQGFQPAQPPPGMPAPQGMQPAYQGWGGPLVNAAQPGMPQGTQPAYQPPTGPADVGVPAGSIPPGMPAQGTPIQPMQQQPPQGYSPPQGQPQQATGPQGQQMPQGYVPQGQQMQPPPQNVQGPAAGQPNPSSRAAQALDQARQRARRQ